MKEAFFLPKEMEKDRDIFERSLRGRIKIELNTANSSSGSLNIFTSRLGSSSPFYFPNHLERPLDPKGKPLELVAQINFSELYQNDELSQKILQDDQLKYLPRSGIMCFFVGFGYEENVGDLNKIYYFPDIVQAIDTTAEFSPLTFTFDKQVVSSSCYEWMALIGEEDAYDYAKKIAHLEEVEKIEPSFPLFSLKGMAFRIRKYFEKKHKLPYYYKIAEEYNNHYDPYENQIGGYPNCYQPDERIYDPELRKYDFLLLQLDDYSGAGDILHFYIPLEKLKQLDFSDILCTYDFD